MTLHDNTPTPDARPGERRVEFWDCPRCHSEQAAHYYHPDFVVFASQWLVVDEDRKASVTLLACGHILVIEDKS